MLLKRIDKNVTLLFRYQFSCLIKDFSYSKARILFYQKWHQIREVTLFQDVATRCNCVCGILGVLLF